MAIGLLSFFVLTGTALAGSCRARSADSEHDGLPDCWERRNGLEVGNRDQGTDRDRDGLTAIREFRLDATAGSIFGPYRANDANSDNDGGGDHKGGWTPPILDGWEDLDRDGFGNLAEYIWGTDPDSGVSQPDLPSGGCVMVPRYVRTNGSKNVTPELQAVLDTVPDGRCLELRADARYRLDGTLRIWWRTDLTVYGNGATLFTNRPGRVAPGRANSLRPHVQVIGGDNVTLDGLDIDGPNPDVLYREIYEAEHAFDVKGATGLTILNSSAREIYGDFVYVDDISWPPGSDTNFPTTDLVVSGNTFRGAGRHGFAFGANASDLRFEDNLVSRVHRSGVDFELIPGRTISQVDIVGNTFRAFRLNWIAAGDGVATDIYLGSNEILGDSMHMKIGPRTPGLFHERWTFEGNISDTDHRGDRGVFFIQRVHDITFIANVQPMDPGSGGRVFAIHEDVCGVTLVDNSFPDYKVLFYPVEPPAC